MRNCRYTTHPCVVCVDSLPERSPSGFQTPPCSLGSFHWSPAQIPETAPRQGEKTKHKEHFGCRMTVQNFMKIVSTVFEKFEIFIERSGRQKKVRLYK